MGTVLGKIASRGLKDEKEDNLSLSISSMISISLFTAKKSIKVT
jgi:hypothetical protein